MIQQQINGLLLTVLQLLLKKSNAGWKISTDSGFKGYVAFREATGTDVASIQNDKPEGTSTSYADTQGNSVDL